MHKSRPSFEIAGVYKKKITPLTADLIGVPNEVCWGFALKFYSFYPQGNIAFYDNIYLKNMICTLRAK